MTMDTEGFSRSGQGPCTATRTPISTSTTGQNSTPMPNCAAAQASCPSGTPASGASTLPTTGMNSTGVTPGHARPAARSPAGPPRHQRAMTQAVAANCPRLPSHHSSRAAAVGPHSATATVASSISDTGSAATKGWRMGWRRSSAQASGWRRNRSPKASASASPTAASSAATAHATAPAASPISGTARCHASARPDRPITRANQAGPTKARRGGGARSRRHPYAPAAPGHGAHRTLASRSCMPSIRASTWASCVGSVTSRARNSCCTKQTVIRT